LSPKLIGKIALSNVGFASVITNADNTKNLHLSTFTGFGSDAGYYIPNVGSTLANFSAVKPTKIGGSVVWPNEVEYAPASAFGQEGVLASGGFLVPGKGNGGIFYSARNGTSQGNWVPLYKSSNGFFYHRAIVADVDKDGVPDILTAKATKPLIGAGYGSLTYLKAKDPKNPLAGFNEISLGPHADTFFRFEDINGDGIPEIISTEYWGSLLTLITTKDPNGSFGDPSKLAYNIIDPNVGKAFDIEIVDLNGDGKKDLLVTNHQGSSDKPTGEVYAYEIPDDITLPSSAWKKVNCHFCVLHFL
jgi:hypothetical protein